MKNKYKFIVLLFLMGLIFKSAYAIPPTFDMTLKNIQMQHDSISGADSVIQFDIYMQWTNSGKPGVDSFEYGSNQMYITFDPLIANGGTLSAFIVHELPAGGLPVNLQTPTVQVMNPVGSGRAMFQGSSIVPDGANNFIISNISPGTCIGRFKITTSSHTLSLITPNFKFSLIPPYDTFPAYMLPPLDPGDPDLQIAEGLYDTIVNNYVVEESLPVNPPTFNMFLRDIELLHDPVTGSDSVIQFDVYMQWTNSDVPGIDTFEYGATQLNIGFNPLLANGGNLNAFIVNELPPGGLPVNLQTPSVQIILNQLFQGAPINPSGTNNFIISNVFPGTCIGRFKIATSSHSLGFVHPDFKFQLRSPNKTFPFYMLPPNDPDDPDRQFAAGILDTIVNNFEVEENPPGVAPTFDMSLRNIELQPDSLTGADSVIQFDIFMRWTNSGTSGVDSFEYGATELNITFNPLIANGGTLNAFIVNALPPGGLPVNLQTPSVHLIPNPNGNGTMLFQGESITPDGANNFMISNTSPGTCIGRYKITTSSHSLGFVSPDFKFQLKSPNRTFPVYMLPPFDPDDPDSQFPIGLLDTIMNHYLVQGNPAFTVQPTFNMTLNNIVMQPNNTNGSDSVVQFDVYMLWTNSTFPGVHPFEYGSNQLDITFNPLIANGGTLTASKVTAPLPPGALPPFLQTPTVQIIPNPDGSGNLLFQGSAIVPNGANNFTISDVFPGTCIGRFRIRTSAHTLGLVTPNFHFQLTPPNNTYPAYMLPPLNPDDPDNQLAAGLLDTVANIYLTIENPSLPVEIASFTSSVNKNTVGLAWATSSETNNQGFDIERSVVGTTEWSKVGYVGGNGTVTEIKNYSFTDRVSAPGHYGYRLKQIDFNGNGDYHLLNSEVEVGIPSVYAVSQNYPNPFNPTTKIDYDIPYDGKVSILLYDISGREVGKLVNEIKTAGYYTVQFNASDLSSGMYFYRITATGNSQNFVQTKKMVLIK